MTSTIAFLPTSVWTRRGQRAVAAALSLVLWPSLLLASDAPSTASTTATAAEPDLRPQISELHRDIRSYTEGDGTMLIDDGDAVVTAPDGSTHFAGGWLAVALMGGGDHDRLGIADEGDGPGEIGFDGTVVRYGGVPFGRGDTTGSLLRVSFTSSDATLEAVQALIRAVTFSIATDNPFDNSRLARFGIDDGGNGGGSPTSAPADVTIHVSPINDPPSFARVDAVPVFLAGGDPAQLDADAVMHDPDMGAWGSAVLRLARAGGADGTDVFSFAGSSVSTLGPSLLVDGSTVGSYTQTGGELEIRFEDPAWFGPVNEVLQAIAYSNVGQDPPASVTLSYHLTDGNTGAQGSGGAGEASASIAVTIVDEGLFHTVTPCRALDTRAMQPLASGVPAALRFAGWCGVPEEATAVAVNVTVTRGTGAGHVAVRTSDAVDGDVSTVHFQAGDTRANNAILRLGAGGELRLEAFVAGDGTADVLVDVVGYFE